MRDPAVAAIQQLFVRHQSAVRAFALALTGDFAAALGRAARFIHDNATRST